MGFLLKFAAFAALSLLLVHTQDAESATNENGFNACSRGQRQSPIDIPLAATRSLKRSSLKIGKGYSKNQEFDVENSKGQTLEGAVDNADESKFTLSGELMEGGEYILEDFHFHWGPLEERLGSEHSIGGKVYSTELHLIHYHSNYSNSMEAIRSGNPRAVAAVGIIFELGNERNRALDPILKSAKTVENPQDEGEGSKLNLAKLIFNGEETVTFAHYEGSLTTGECEEVVMWNVKMSPNPISKDQVAVFSRLKDNRGRPLLENYREIQPVNGRKIEYHTVTLPKKVVNAGNNGKGQGSAKPSGSNSNKGSSVPGNAQNTNNWRPSEPEYGQSSSSNRRPTDPQYERGSSTIRPLAPGFAQGNNNRRPSEPEYGQSNNNVQPSVSDYERGSSTGRPSVAGFGQNNKNIRPSVTDYDRGSSTIRPSVLDYAQSSNANRPSVPGNAQSSNANRPSVPGYAQGNNNGRPRLSEYDRGTSTGRPSVPGYPQSNNNLQSDSLPEYERSSRNVGQSAPEYPRNDSVTGSSAPTYPRSSSY